MTATALNTKISKVENKIPDTSSLVTTTVLKIKFSEGENNIPDNFKYITTVELNKLTAEHVEARLKQADLVNKTGFDNKLTTLINKLIQIKQNI